jgi:hypothetical protein
MKKRTRVKTNLLWVLLYIAAIHAKQVGAEPEDDAPSLELLEYLGEYQTQEGQWIDPMSFLETDTDNDANTYKTENGAEDQEDE